MNTTYMNRIRFLKNVHILPHTRDFLSQNIGQISLSHFTPVKLFIFVSERLIF